MRPRCRLSLYRRAHGTYGAAHVSKTVLSRLQPTAASRTKERRANLAGNRSYTTGGPSQVLWLLRWWRRPIRFNEANEAKHHSPSPSTACAFSLMWLCEGKCATREDRVQPKEFRVNFQVDKPLGIPEPRGQICRCSARAPERDYHGDQERNEKCRAEDHSIQFQAHLSWP